MATAITQGRKDLESLQKRIGKAVADLADMRTEEAELCKLLNVSRVRVGKNGGGVKHRDDGARAALKAAVVAYLKRFKTAKRNREILAALKGQKCLDPFSSPNVTLSQILSEDSDFLRIRKGLWQIADRGTAPKPKRNLQKKASRKTR
jgi:hypothetical protein